MRQAAILIGIVLLIGAVLLATNSDNTTPHKAATVAGRYKFNSDLSPIRQTNLKYLQDQGLVVSMKVEGRTAVAVVRPKFMGLPYEEKQKIASTLIEVGWDTDPNVFRLSLRSSDGREVGYAADADEMLLNMAR